MSKFKLGHGFDTKLLIQGKFEKYRRYQFFTVSRYRTGKRFQEWHFANPAKCIVGQLRQLSNICNMFFRLVTVFSYS